MNEDEIPTLGYAPGPPRPMRNKVIVAVSTCAAGIAIAAAGLIYTVRPLACPGIVSVSRGSWQTQPAGGFPTTQPESSGDVTGPATQPSTDDHEQDTATAQ